jgi:hypothetical protein
MATSTLFIIPFQVILSWLILRRFRGVIPAPVYSLVVIALVIDLAAMFNPNLFPLSSYLITVALLRYYGKSWWSVAAVTAMNGLMFLGYFMVPMGQYYVTAVSYYTAYTIMQSNALNEVYLKNVLFYASAKHLCRATAWWVFTAEMNYAVDVLSVVVVYYMVRTTLYYYRGTKLWGRTIN